MQSGCGKLVHSVNEFSKYIQLVQSVSIFNMYSHFIQIKSKVVFTLSKNRLTVGCVKFALFVLQ